jgi:hypothetical protein
MPLSTRPADAVLIPESMKQGNRKYHRVNSIMAIAEPLLGCNSERGEKGYMRRTTMSVEEGPNQRTILLFVTKNPHDTLLFPTNHPRHPQPRYRWEQDGRIRLGYLIASPEDDLGVYAEVPR